MVPDLLEATRDYWRELDKLEAAYQRDEVSVEEVDARVEELMQDLGQTRREAFRVLWLNLQTFVQQQRETLAGAVAIGLLAYVWFALNNFTLG